MEKKQPHSIDILKPLKKLSKRFHLTLFFVFIVACLSGAVLLINKTIQENATDPTYTSTISAGSIDQATLNRLNALHTSAQGAPAPVLPQGRINPVGE
jgi:hypothetical protein